MPKDSRFRRQFDKQNGKQSKALSKSVTTAPLSYLLINVKEIELEKLSVIDM